MKKIKKEYIEKECVFCGNTFLVKNTYSARRTQTCSSKCARQQGSKNNRTVKKCIVCNKDTETSKSNLLPRCDKCVSDKKKYRHVCKICNEDFSSNKYGSELCSQKCTNEWNNKNLVDIECFLCHKKFQRPSFTIPRNKRLFCSNECGNKQFTRDNPNRYGTNWNTVRKNIFARDNNNCLKCGSKENLECHHFKKMKSFDTPEESHFDENLGTFCKTCHKEVESKNYESLSHFLKDIV